MQTASGWWRQFHRADGDESGQLLVFPHAGSGASRYRALSQAFAELFEVSVCQYPGRQDRAGEPLLTRIGDMAAGAFAAWRDSRPAASPSVVFGHSMGAYVAFEFVRLAEANGFPVRLLCASSAVAPMRAADMPRHPTDDHGILERLTYLEGTDAAVLASPEIMRLALPVLRGDYAASDDYRCAPDVRVAAGVHVLGGADDPLITARHLYEWQSHTDVEIAVTQFEGGHFYLDRHLDGVAELVAGAAIAVG
jgi:surfactin synthase thioesterase subunit